MSLVYLFDGVAVTLYVISIGAIVWLCSHNTDVS